MLGLTPHLGSRLGQGIISSSLTTCTMWSGQRRVMAGDFSGKFSLKYHPWVKEMMDSRAPFNYAMKGAQVGVTECGINRAFYVLDQLRRDVLYVLPTAGVASDFAKTRFDTALHLSDYLGSLFTETNSVGLKQTPYANLYIRGAGGKGNLVSVPVSELILDELDRMPRGAVQLALKRLGGQITKTVFAMSTPTVHQQGIHELYLTGTQEHFFFECPHCHRQTELIWPDSFVIVGEGINDPRCGESHVRCKECKAKIEHHEKPDVLKTAHWVPTVSQPNWDIRSWYINQLYSFTVKPVEIARDYFRGLADECEETEFYNQDMGMPFIAKGAQVTDEDIGKVIGNYVSKDMRPKNKSRFITLGIDQGKLCHWVAVEWFTDKMSYDINVSAFAKVLAYGQFPEDDWERGAADLMSEWQVQACVVDADPQINEARRFAQNFLDFVWLCRYRKGKGGKSVAISEEDTGSPIITVDRTNWMSAALGRFRRQRISLPQDITPEFRAHIKSPVRTWQRDENNNPRAVFLSGGADHYAHALTYAELALPLAATVKTGQDIEKFL